MSVLAVCVPRPSHGGAAPKPRVTQFHTNLWSFRSLRGRRFVVDLGVNLTNPTGATPVESFHLFVPYQVAKVQDVTPKLKDVTTAELIFNEACQVTGSGQVKTLDAGGKAYGLGDATPQIEAHPTWSRLDVQLVPAVPGGQNRYVRIRAFIGGSRRVVWSQGGGLASSLTAFDIRFCEKRQWSHDQELAAQIGAMESLDIDVCQYFLIVPAASILVEHAPPMKYMRLLEAGEWEGYLDRKIERSSVYYWKKGDSPVNGQNLDAIGPQRPFRVYAKFRIVNLTVVRFSTWLPLVLLLAAGAGMLEIRFHLLEAMSTRFGSIWNWASSNPSFALVLGLGIPGAVVALGRWLFKKWREASSR